MKQHVTRHDNGSFDLRVTCSFCGKPITTTGRDGMTCEDHCATAWVRWYRLGKLRVLSPEQQAERDVLAARLFGPDGALK